MTKRKLNKEFQIRDIYHNQLQSSKRRGMSLPSYTVDELKEWCLAQPKYHDLHDAWVKSGFQRSLSPSVDRTDDYQPYSLNNITLMTSDENLKKAFKDCFEGRNTKRSKGVIQEDLNGNFIDQYPSCNLAGRAVGAINGSRVSAVCRNIRNKAHGFKWRYV